MGIFGNNGKKKIAIEIDENVYNAFVNSIEEKDFNDAIEDAMRDYIFSKNTIDIPDPEPIRDANLNGVSHRSRVIQLAIDNGYNDYDELTYAKWTSSKYYMNPDPENLGKNWQILLDDIDNCELHILFIPKGVLSSEQFAVRDNGKLSIRIGKDFIDTPKESSHVDFSKYFEKTIYYGQSNNPKKDNEKIAEPPKDSLDALLQKWLRKKTAPYNVMKAYFVLSSDGKTVNKDIMQRYAFNELCENNFQTTFCFMKNGGNHVSEYSIFDLKYGEIVVLADDVKETVEKYRQEFLK